MAGLTRRQIAEMEWTDFTDRLSTATREAKGTAPEEQAMREYFGDEEFAYLRQLAARAKARRTRAGEPLGIVILVPGIMGSSLVAVKKGVKEDLVWVDYLGLAAGQMQLLKLAADGRKESDTSILIRTSTVDKRTYSRIVTALGGRWNVQPFAFDWRKDIDLASDALAALIKEKYSRTPVHLVAHSMGGLVSRNFIRRHKDVWDGMQVDGRGGQLIMLGTPNYGSFDSPQVLTGEEKLVRMLAAVDLKHSLDGLLEILATFVGAYLMLPAPAKITPAEQDLFSRSAWGSLPVSETHLKRAKEFHASLADGGTVDPERMRYIAGCNRKTLCGVEIKGPGRFTYKTTFDGDGRVAHALGLLDGVPTYFADEIHGDLPRNEKIIDSVDQILETGRTMILPMQPIAGRAATAGTETWYRPIREYQLGSQLETLSRRAAAEPLDPDSLRLAEEVLVRAAAGGAPPALAEVKTAATERRAKPRKLTIELGHGDVAEVPAPLVVVGHYKGVTPINAIGALDRRLNHWIRYAVEHSILGGDLGQLFFIPVWEKQIAAQAVVVAGMGQEGKFTLHDLRYLAHNVTYAIGALKIQTFATVLLGGGAGNLPEDKALSSMLGGVCDALDRLPEGVIQRIILVEIDRERHKRLGKLLDRIRKDLPPGNEIVVESREYPGARKATGAARAGREAPSAAEKFGPRVTVERDGDVLRYSALTRQSVIPVREIEIQGFYQDGISERLMSSQTRSEQEMFGRLLNTSLLPEDFQEFLDTTEPLTLILDRSTAAFPWEMSCFQRRSGPAFFGPDLKLTRQFRTLLSPPPGIAPQLNNRLRVLVIADPAADRLHLPGAQREGEEVVRLFNLIKRLYQDLNIEVIDRIGPAECEPIEVLALVLNGEFDIVHFAGHGVFDAEKPNRSGWVFGLEKGGSELRILSAREIFRARRVPRLVFSNACFSAVVQKGKPLSAGEMNRNLAGLAEAFFERGVQNYIGAGWPVADDPAVEFAKEFYALAITGRSEQELQRLTPGSAGDRPQPAKVSEALACARHRILDRGSTWGAYQHYGDAGTVLLSLEPTGVEISERVPKRRAVRRK